MFLTFNCPSQKKLCCFQLGCALVQSQGATKTHRNLVKLLYDLLQRSYKKKITMKIFCTQN